MNRQRLRERGVTLVTVLMILLVVTVVGLGAARISLMGEKSSRYDRDYQVALQSAEIALMDAEFDIRGPGGTRATMFTDENTVDFITGCGSSGTVRGLCEAKVSGRPVWYDVDFTDTSATSRSVAFGTFTGRAFDAVTASTTVAGVRPAHLPRYIIEVFKDQAVGGDASIGQSGDPAKPKIYRVTAMGFGPREDVQVVLQMTFDKE